MAVVEALAKLEMFKPFSESQLGEVAEITEKKSFKQFSRIYERGNPAKHLFVVTKGLVSLRRIEPGGGHGRLPVHALRGPAQRPNLRIAMVGASAITDDGCTTPPVAHSLARPTLTPA